MGPRSWSAVEATVHLHSLGGWEGALIRIPRGIADLSPQSRGLLVLDTVHGSVMRLADSRGWDTESIETVRQHCLRSRLDYRWEGPWKASPSRKLEARGDFRLIDDGFGLARIVVRDRTTHLFLGVSVTEPAFSTTAGFKRSATTLRCAGSTGVSMVPWSGLLGERGTVRADVAHLADWTPRPEYEPIDLSSKRPEIQFLED